MYNKRRKCNIEKVKFIECYKHINKTNAAHHKKRKHKIKGKRGSETPQWLFEQDWK